MMSRKVSESVQSSVRRNSKLPVLVRLAVFPLFIGMFLSIGAMAQSANIAVGSASGLPGAAINIPVSFTPGTTGVSTLQFDLVFSSSLVYGSTTIGPAATAASKSVSGSAISGGARVLVFGLNQNSIGSGVIANIQLDISGGAPVGTVPIAIAGIVASDSLANAVSTTGTAGSVQVLAISDTTPPVISGVTSSNLSETGATITWTTNEVANSQVEYGTTNSYGSGTVLNSSMVTLHSQGLTGLSANTLYHYRVKSSDAAGNQSTSGDYTFTTSTQDDTTPPEISEIAVSDITSISAKISWTTDEQADSEVEYWESGQASKTADLGTLTTAHSLTLNELKRLTQYTFRVKSTDDAGNQAVASELTFSTAGDGAPALVFPRFSSGLNTLGLDTMSGLGLANLDYVPANVTFTAVDDDGTLTAWPNFTNPVNFYLYGKQQAPIIDSNLFGDGIFDLNSNGYVKLDRTSDDTSGFFLIFDGDLHFQDGANLSDTKLTDFVFPEIQTDGYNKISIINDNTEEANLTLDLVGADGRIRSSVSRVIVANGSLTTDLFGDLFAGIQPVADAYVRVKSSIGVQSFQVMRQGSGDMAMLAAQDLTTGGTTLYSPLYAMGGQYQTSLSVINLDSVPGTVSLQLIGQDGIQMGSSKVVDISANGKLYIDDPRFFFAGLDLNVLNTGYLEIKGNGIRLIGSTVFCDINRQTFSAALAMVYDLPKSVLFSHVASNDVYFTGIAILNPNPTPVYVRLELYDANGILRESRRIYLGAKNRQSKLLWQYFDSLVGQNQTSGYVRIISDSPIASYAAFGTNDLSMISAIPPQVIQ